jgi:hypothetical protein
MTCMVVSAYDLLKCMLKDEMLYFALDMKETKIKLCMK